MKAKVICNIEEVKNRLKRLQSGADMSALMEFCIDVSLFNELAFKMKTTENEDDVTRFGSVALLTGIILGMRYTYDYGAPEFVLEQFEELPMFRNQERE